jgi:hypothetical protein
MGVIIIAVAAFDETSVNTMVIKYMSANNTYGCQSTEDNETIFEMDNPIQSAVPVERITNPSGMSAAINIMTCQLID